MRQILKYINISVSTRVNETDPLHSWGSHNCAELNVSKLILSFLFQIRPYEMICQMM